MAAWLAQLRRVGLYLVVGKKGGKEGGFTRQFSATALGGMGKQSVGRDGDGLLYLLLCRRGRYMVAMSRYQYMANKTEPVLLVQYGPVLVGLMRILHNIVLYAPSQGTN